ncbi:hypothetical protein BLOT_003874 [Blomia tropicalis]|nr:hypothetical protein BLOT_003874 [Blomia tropicalis]
MSCLTICCVPERSTLGKLGSIPISGRRSTMEGGNTYGHNKRQWFHSLYSTSKLICQIMENYCLLIAICARIQYFVSYKLTFIVLCCVVLYRTLPITSTFVTFGDR